MIQAVLFDLDDTLLGNHLDTFLPSYFALLGRYAESIMPRDQFIQELLTCTEITVRNTDPTRTNYEVFWHTFTQRTGLDATTTEQFFDHFYRTEFPQLEQVSQRRPAAQALVDYCLQNGLQVVVATNPLFPTAAIHERLRWAGFSATETPFALVTTMDNMHTTKPHRQYYEEIGRKIGVAPANCLMVGDSWENDMKPAKAVGMKVYWVPADGDIAENPDLLDGCGSMDDLWTAVRNGWLSVISER